jgi:hypothetical protein
MEGTCHFPHKKSHFLLLNLVPPATCIEDEEEDAKLSKK